MVIPNSRTFQLRLFTSIAFGLCLVVVVLGAYTRLVDAGLGCPDWPGCYGDLLVPGTPSEIIEAQSLFPDSDFDSFKAWTEMIHRYAATLLGLLVVALPILAWRTGTPMGLAVILAVLVIVQGAFGAWTVTLKLWPQVVTAHLAGGFAILALLWVYAARQGLVKIGAVASRIRLHAQIALLVLVVQILLGGWTSSNYAALACPDFPLCHGVLVPPMDFGEGFNVFQDVGPNYLGGLLTSEARIAIQMAHRLGAVISMIVIAALGLRLHGNLRLAVLGLLAAQITIGIANVVFSLPLVVATAHNLFAALLLLALVTVVLGTMTRVKED